MCVGPKGVVWLFNIHINVEESKKVSKYHIRPVVRDTPTAQTSRVGSIMVPVF